MDGEIGIMTRKSNEESENVEERNKVEEKVCVNAYRMCDGEEELRYGRKMAGMYDVSCVGLDVESSSCDIIVDGEEDSSPWDVDTSSEKISVLRSRAARSDEINNIPCNNNSNRKEDLYTYVGDSRARSLLNKSKLPCASLQSQKVYSMPVVSNVFYKEEEEDRIDSALVSALSDPKERMGLLRLEQVLIEFMNDRMTRFIEVGGPNNSIVAGGLGNRLSEEVRGRQTSFQRLCLHRLADRFNIVRENTQEDYSGGNFPSLIRLLKVKNSRIPCNLLIDLDLSILAEEETTTPKQQSSLPNSFSSSSLNKEVAKKPPRKMKIIKRQNSSSNGDGKERQHKGRQKGKKLSEKEKAYAEARARIFNELEERRRAEMANSSSSTPPLSIPPSPSSDNSELGHFSDSSDLEEDGKAVSKVTWRNRREEENDPDFRRGVARSITAPVSPMLPQIPYGTPHGVFCPSQSSGYLPTAANVPISYQQQQVFYPNQVNSSCQYHPQTQFYQQPFYASNPSAIRTYSNGMIYTNSKNERRTENIVYNMEEFPLLKR